MCSRRARPPSKNTSPNSDSPVIWRIPRISTPGCAIGIRKKVMPP
jgi:hypothetical protein